MTLSEKIPFKVFVSRASEDKDIKVLKYIIEILGDNGVEVYIAENDRQFGEKLTIKVKDNLNTSTVIIVFLTRNGVMSAWVQQEIGFATALNKHVFIFYDENEVKETGKYFGMRFDEEACKLSDIEGIGTLIGRIIKLNQAYQSKSSLNESGQIWQGLKGVIQRKGWR